MLVYVLIFTTLLDLVLVSEQSQQTGILWNGISDVNLQYVNRQRRSEEIKQDVKTASSEKKSQSQDSGADKAHNQNVNPNSLHVSGSTESKTNSSAVHAKQEKKMNSSSVVVNINTNVKTAGSVISDHNVTDSHNSNPETDLPGVYKHGKFLQRFGSGALLRGFYVFVGLSVIAVMYFIVRAVGLRKKRWGPRRYGVLMGNGVDVELTPLGTGDGDEEESTVF